MDVDSAPAPRRPLSETTREVLHMAGDSRQETSAPMKTSSERLGPNTIVLGDATKRWPCPERFADLIVTSPPYWQHRDNPSTETVVGGDEACKHSWNGEGVCHCGAWQGQIGQEYSPQDYVRHLADLLDREGRRVLSPTGQLWVNIGDTFSRGVRGVTWAPAKQKLLIPHRFAIEMQDRGWILRNEIVWAKSVMFDDGTTKGGGMPSAVHDRFNVTSETFFGFVKPEDLQQTYYVSKTGRVTTVKPDGDAERKQYFSDLNPVRLKPKWVNQDGQRIDFYGRVAGTRPNAGASPKQHKAGQPHLHIMNHPLGKNPGSVWLINIDPFEGQKLSHTAPYPRRLIELIVKFSCPSEKCSKCALPVEQLYDREKKEFVRATCECGAPFQKGLVFDPFMGSGTSAVVAKNNRRAFAGLELNLEFRKEALARLGIHETSHSALESFERPKKN